MALFLPYSSVIISVNFISNPVCVASFRSVSVNAAMDAYSVMPSDTDSMIMYQTDPRTRLRPEANQPTKPKSLHYNVIDKQEIKLTGNNCRYRPSRKRVDNMAILIRQKITVVIVIKNCPPHNNQRQ